MLCDDGRVRQCGKYGEMMKSMGIVILGLARTVPHASELHELQ